MRTRIEIKCRLARIASDMKWKLPEGRLDAATDELMAEGEAAVEAVFAFSPEREEYERVLASFCRDLARDAARKQRYYTAMYLKTGKIPA